MSFELLRTPTLLLQTVFWFGLALLSGLAWSVYSVFSERQILLSHLRDIFDTLTRFRIWTIRNRRLYTGLISALIVVGLLTIVFFAEKAHYLVYRTDPLFTSVPEFYNWIIIPLISGLEKGQAPQTFIGLLIAGVMPLFLIGSILTIVRFTSEHGHEVLMNKMGTGEIPSHRVVFLNYQSKYDSTIERLLRNTDSFVVVLARDEHLQDAEGLKDNFDEMSDTSYRLLVDELSYSNEVLFDRYDLLGADEVFLLSDRSDDSDYKNLLLLSEINERTKRWDRMEQAFKTCPHIVWEATKTKFKDLSEDLDSETLQERIYPVSFYEDCSQEILANLGHPISGINQYFGLDEETDRPEWIEGYGLENYAFTSESLTADDREALEEISAMRERSGDGTRKEHDLGEMSRLKRTFLQDLEARIQAEQRDSPRIKPFYGVIVDVAGNRFPMDPSTAFLSRQIETATGSVHLTKNRFGTVDKPETVDSLNPTGDVYIVNLNNSSKHFLRDIATGDVSTADTDVVVFHTDSQVKPDVDLDVDYVEYDTVTQVARHLFEDEQTRVATMTDGDALLLFLDHDEADPHIQTVKSLDNIDEQLEEEQKGLSHNDIFLGVESAEDGFNRIYEYLSVDKTINSLVTQKTFLRNLIELQNADIPEELVRDGTISRHEQFEWALQTAYNLRHYVIQSAADLSWNETRGDTLVGRNHLAANSEVREYKRPSNQLFASFEIRRGGRHRDVPVVEFIELTEDKEITDDEYLLFFPTI